jgi:outer membrane lipoprotein-sorting protein
MGRLDLDHSAAMNDGYHGLKSNIRRRFLSHSKAITRRSALYLASLGLVAGLMSLGTSFSGVEKPALANERTKAISAISNHFRNVPTMKGEFVQFGPKGEQTGGTFYIERPGKLRLDYEDPSPLLLISNGKTLAVRNAKLKTWNYYPLDKTPLSLLLSNRIDIDDKSIRSVQTSNDMTTVVMGDKTVFGDAEITLLFDPVSEDLRQWTVKDAQGKETSVLILNVEKNISLSDDLFKISNRSKNRRKTQP